jgi:hypothetical protein
MVTFCISPEGLPLHEDQRVKSDRWCGQSAFTSARKQTSTQIALSVPCMVVAYWQVMLKAKKFDSVFKRINNGNSKYGKSDSSSKGDNNYQFNKA